MNFALPRQARRAPVARPLVLPLVLCAMLLHAGPCAAEDDKRSAQLRDAARRAQLAAQQAQQELATVKAERDQFAAADATRQGALNAAQAQGRAQAQSLRASLAQAQAERDRLQAELTSERGGREALQHELEGQQAKLQAGQQALDDQRRVTQAVTALLERSVKALAAAEDANRQLHAMGLKAVQAYTEATPEAMRARSEPFLGLAAVRLDNEAETLRREMAAQRVAP